MVLDGPTRHCYCHLLGLRRSFCSDSASETVAASVFRSEERQYRPRAIVIDLHGRRVQVYRRKRGKSMRSMGPSCEQVDGFKILTADKAADFLELAF